MSELRPMLATQVPLDAIEPYLVDEAMVAQQKVDGDRLMVVVEDGKVTALNRKGTLYRNPLPRRVLTQFAGLPGSWCFDGELLDELWLFDLVRARDVVAPTHEYGFRLSTLERCFAAWQPDTCVRLLPTARTQWAKRALVERVLSSRNEGVIFRDVHSPYIPGPRRTEHLLKAKAWKTVDCVVTGVRVGGRHNCHVSVFENGHLVDRSPTPGSPPSIGSCAMLGKPPVAVGDVVEVKYLYADTAGRLVHTAFLRVRDDKAPSECTIDQLVYTNRTVIDHGGLIPLTSKKRKQPGEGLGRTQVLLLHLLANDSKSVRQLANDWPGLSESSVRSTLNRLGMRGLVDRKSSYGTLKYHLTREGAEVEHTLVPSDEDEEEAS